MRRRHQTATPDLSAYEYGKVQPQAPDIEQMVLGALMLERKAVPVVAQLLRAESFYVPAHQLIFKAIAALYAAGDPVDIVTVIQKLKQQGNLEEAGGAPHVADLTDRVASAANVEHHAMIVQQKYIMRCVIRNASVLIKEAYEDVTDVFDLVGKMQAMSIEMAHSVYGNRTSTGAEVVREAQRRVMELHDKPELLTGVPLGFTALDRFLGGWQKGNLVIMAARPGMGKTALAVQCARNAARMGVTVGVFSLEMSKGELGMRMVQMDAELDAHDLRNPAERMDAVKLGLATKVEGEENLLIDDRGGLSLLDVRAQATTWAQEYDLGMIVIDYLQLMTLGVGDGKSKLNREQEIGAISRGLKGLAKELNVPVIALSQLSRAVETRGGDKRPQLSDLRESGAIEQDADVVMFLYRPEYYGFTEDEDGNSTRGVAEVNIAKHRNGACDKRKLHFDAKYIRFTDEVHRYFVVQPAVHDVPVNDHKLINDARKRAANDFDNDNVPF